MTVPTEVSTSSYTGDGGTTSFSIGFVFLGAESLDVSVDDISKTLGVDFSVNGSAVEFATAPGAGAAVAVSRRSEFVQPTDLRTHGSFSPSSHEDQLDRIVFMFQDLKRRMEIAAGAFDTFPDFRGFRGANLGGSLDEGDATNYGEWIASNSLLTSTMFAMQSAAVSIGPATTTITAAYVGWVLAVVRVLVSSGEAMVSGLNILPAAPGLLCFVNDGTAGGFATFVSGTNNIHLVGGGSFSLVPGASLLLSAGSLGYFEIHRSLGWS